jgi:bifunctional pyridoxal-dependent enzyme with beta-cystathionase and maltose regulon repressor activities
MHPFKGGSAFGAAGRGYLRINVSCPRSLLEERLKRMARVLESFGTKAGRSGA